ncbi:hypothetical protein BD289DRAFT_444448 [Coniella lustricola]|uniref:Very long-chain fatty acid transport protein n=1 Tax=Coniella lustricola TaxID=2025994 RepID=A0A2T2ZVZ1_9PEZI|nr:hypothetical protein BD289DRAFT_444448 [Coniella lustricola]
MAANLVLSAGTVPLAIAAPAAVAAAAYINAKTHFWYDLTMMNNVLPVTVKMLWRERTGRLNVFYDLEHWATNAKTADRAFLLFGDRSWTYRQALEATLRHGTWLQEKLGIKRGDIVAMDFTNSDDFVFIWFGLWAIGAKPAFINYNLTGHALVHCVKAAGGPILLIDPKVAHHVDDDVRQALSNVRLEIFSDECKAQVLATEPGRLPDRERSVDAIAEMANLIFTSGTTGLPKAAVVSWGKIHAAGMFAAGFVKTRGDDIFYTCMPLYHSSGSIMCVVNCLLSGATVALGAKFSTRTFWHDVRRHNATIIQYVGETLRYLLAAPVETDPATGANLDRSHRVRVALGNGLRPDVWNRFKERFGIPVIAEFYGATEGSFATFNLSRNDFALGAIGRNGWMYALLMRSAIVLVEVDFATDLPRRDPQTGLCRAVKAGEPGECLFRLPDKDLERRFQGYYGDSAATNKKIMRGVLKKGDAWFRTGDVLRWDSEGRMFFHDRIGDTFRWKSENVSTAEVSQALGGHASVVEANVYGVQLPHHDGRAGCAAVVLREDVSLSLLSLSSSSSSSSSMSATSLENNDNNNNKLLEETLASLAQHVRASLPKFAVPLFLRLIEPGQMQTTGTNKQQKHNLRSQGVDPALTGSDRVFWLRGERYVPFTKRDWEQLSGGHTKL